MKIVAYVIITLSLAVGAIAATTAYSPTLDAVSTALKQPETRLTLGAPAGVSRDEFGQPVLGEGGKPVPLYKPGEKKPTVVTPDMVSKLRAEGVTRIRVREFAVSRWDHGWVFLVGVVGLLVGAVIVRVENRRLIRAQRQAAADHPEGPDAALRRTREAIQALRAELSATDVSRRELLDRITRDVGEIQQTHVETFVDARAALIARFGLGGFAAIMDRFAAAERRLNRAWSAAADENLAEASESLEAAEAVFGQVQGLLDR